MPFKTQKMDHSIPTHTLREREMAGVFSRGAQTVNSMFLKPVTQKTYHSKSSSFDKARKLDKEEAKENMNRMGENGSNWWLRDGRTGIYYPKGQEKVMDGIPTAAGKDISAVHWFSYNDHTSI